MFPNRGTHPASPNPVPHSCQFPISPSGEQIPFAAVRHSNQSTDFEDTNGLVTKEQFEVFQRKITKDYVRWLTNLKKMAYESQVPLPVEVMDLVSQSAGELGSGDECVEMGYRSLQIHPDIYMNELLQGMRMIHQVLPAIMKKLGMTEDDFHCDSSELSLPVNAQGFIDHPKQEPEDEDGDEPQVLPEPRKPF